MQIHTHSYIRLHPHSPTIEHTHARTQYLKHIKLDIKPDWGVNQKTASYKTTWTVNQKIATDERNTSWIQTWHFLANIQSNPNPRHHVSDRKLEHFRGHRQMTYTT